VGYKRGRASGVRTHRRAIAVLSALAIATLGLPAVALAAPVAEDYSQTGLIQGTKSGAWMRASDSSSAVTFSLPVGQHGTFVAYGPVECTDTGVAWTCEQLLHFTPDRTFFGTETAHYEARNDSDETADGTISLTYIADTGRPSGTIRAVGAASGTTETAIPNLVLTLAGTDAQSDVAEVRVSNWLTASGALGRARAYSTPQGGQQQVIPWSLAYGRPIVAARGEIPSVPEGGYTVYAQWMDFAGNLSRIKLVEVVVDRHAPAFGILQLGASPSRTNDADVRVTFSADLSDMHAYEVEYSLNGAAWSPYAANLEYGSFDVGLSMSATHRFRARIRDVAANWTGWVTTPVFTPAELTAEHGSIKYVGTWKPYRSSPTWPAYYTRYATAAGASASLTFTGNALAWVTVVGPMMGKATIYVDGVSAGTVDLYWATQVPQVEAFRVNWATKGTHTVTIKVLGTAGRPSVHLQHLLITK
jgi:hypothetical protein